VLTLRNAGANRCIKSIVCHTRPVTVDVRDERESLDAQVDAVLAASRVLVGVSAESIAAVEDQVTLTQLRALVVIASHRSLNLGALAGQLGVHASSATRICDRLVNSGLLSREDRPDDRRNVQLTLTSRGKRLVATVMRRRKTALRTILGRIPAESRSAVLQAFQQFAIAGGEVPEQHLWALAWETAAPSS
jgi:DNA-binding MarR family transcriptional regulator